MADLKEALKNAVTLDNIDYESDGTVVLAVDTLYRAVGFYIYQKNTDTMKKTFIKFGLIILE